MGMILHLLMDMNPRKVERVVQNKIKTDDANEVTLRKCRNQLNKLTPEKFWELVKTF